MLFAARDGEARRFEAPGLPELRLGGLDRGRRRASCSRPAPASCARGGARPPHRRHRRQPARPARAAVGADPPPSSPGASRCSTRCRSAPASSRRSWPGSSGCRRTPARCCWWRRPTTSGDVGHRAAGRRPRSAPPARRSTPPRQAGLLRSADGRLGCAIRWCARPSTRRRRSRGARAAHRALAAALDGEEAADRRAWHLAAAAVEPDAAVVEALEQAAARARRRSAFAAASLAFERAAALSRATAPARARRLGAAAENAWFAGELERARILLDRAAPLSTGSAAARRHGALAGPDRAHQRRAGGRAAAFLPAAREVAPLDAGRALYLCNLASLAAAYAADSAGQHRDRRARGRASTGARSRWAACCGSFRSGSARLAAGDAPRGRRAPAPGARARRRARRAGARPGAGGADPGRPGGAVPGRRPGLATG